MSHNALLGEFGPGANVFGGHGEAEFMPRAGTNSSRAAGVHCVLVLTATVYWPTGHFGQTSDSGNVQDSSEFLAAGLESFKKVPGLQQSIRFPGGSATFSFLKSQLELHHTPWLNALAPLNVEDQEST